MTDLGLCQNRICFEQIGRIAGKVVADYGDTGCGQDAERVAVKGLGLTSNPEHSTSYFSCSGC